MSFYNDWNDCLIAKDNDYDYIEAFLKRKDYTTRILKNGSAEQIELFSNIMLNYDLKRMIFVLDDSFYCELSPSMIMQFSNLENGTIKLTELLYNGDCLSYPEIGKKLIDSEELSAATKYGENHSKLAREFDLVSIERERPAKVKITNFGKYFAFFDREDQIKLIKILALRDQLIQNLIIKAKKGIVYYSDECNCLSVSTKIRRRSNVKEIMELVFQGLDNSIFLNIIW